MTQETLYPLEQGRAKKGKEAYQKLYQEFLRRLPLVGDFEQLLALAEVYLFAVPAQTGVYESDISPFDHLRLVAGLTQILYRDYQGGILTQEILERSLAALRNGNEEKIPDKPLFLLLRCDLSGIQNFIFNVTARAARSVKARSVYLELFMRYVVKYVLRELRLFSTVIVYLGGGNAELLLPQNAEDVLQKVRKRVSDLLLHLHQGELYLSMEWVPLSLRGFFHFMEEREKLAQRIDLRKRGKFSELDEEVFFERFFVPRSEVVEEGKQCRNCSRKAEGQFEDPEDQLCPVCQSFIDFVDDLKREKMKYLVEEIPPLTRQPRKVQEMFEALGYRIRFTDSSPFHGRIYRLEEVSLEQGNGGLCHGFILGSFHLPDKTFSEIARAAQEEENGKRIGAVRLGYLKMDVDNLGAIFKELAEVGKERATALSLYRAFSRYLELFFGGYLVHFIRQKDPGNRFFYPVFVGGDDLFLVGSFPQMVELA